MRLLCLAFFLCTFALAKSEELVVHVSSRETLKPIYIHFYQDENSGLSQKYKQQLERVFHFDFDHNGRTHVLEESQERKNLATSEKDLLTYDAEKWQKVGADYVVKVRLADAKLSASVFSSENKILKTLDGVSLSGELSKDRRVVHQIADAVHLALFKTKGIASNRILYTVRTRRGEDSSQWIAEVWQADYDGANAKQITHENALCVTPTYLPSSSAHSQNFLYVTYKIGQPKICAAQVDQGIGKRLTYLRGNQLMPVVSPMLDKIAFISDITGNPDLFVQDFSLEKGVIGKPIQVFSAPRATQGTPTFSADGRRLAFVSNKDGTPRIYVLDIPKPGTSLNEVRPLLISKLNRDNTAPAWSPDGSKIAYSALSAGSRQIWVYDVRAKTETQLTDGPSHKENPAWASDSLHLIFNSSTPTQSELYLINLNQKEAVKITEGPGEKRFPSWEPLSSLLKEEKKL